MINETRNLKKRIKKLRAKLVDLKIDALVITNQSNVSYLSGFWGDDSWLIATASSNTLITDSRYTLQAKQECQLCKIYERKAGMAEALAGLFKKLPPKTIAVEDSVQLSVFRAIRKKLGSRLKTASNIVEAIREIKDETEIERIRKAAVIAEQSLAKVLKKIKAGISEKEVAAMLDFEMKRAGAEPSFETNVSFGSNAAMAHHRPGNRKLKKVDTILVDWGAKLNGYCCDLTRCFAVGKVKKLYAKAYKTVLDAQTTAINMLKAGISVRDADKKAKEIIKAQNLQPYGHGLGHGLGIDIHESPAVSIHSKASLHSGNVITIEPGVYLDNKFGIRIEDDVVITDRGCEVLTSLVKSDNVPLLKV